MRSLHALLLILLLLLTSSSAEPLLEHSHHGLRTRHRARATGHRGAQRQWSRSRPLSARAASASSDADTAASRPADADWSEGSPLPGVDSGHSDLASVSDIGTCGGAPLVWQPFEDDDVERRRQLLVQRAGSLSGAPSAELHHRVRDRGRQLPEDDQEEGFKMTAKLAAKNTTLRDNYCRDHTPVPGGQAQGGGGRALAECLLGGHGGCAGLPRSDREAARAAAAALPSLRLLRAPPPCFSVLQRGACSSTQGNPETTPRGEYPRAARPSSDWTWKQWGSCAIVGRSPVIKIAESGRSIDLHDAVWRFNKQSTKGESAFTGRKTTLRIVNKKAADLAALGVLGSLEAEEWVLWQYLSMPHLAGMHRQGLRTRLLAPAFVRWQMNAYFALKRDLETLGLGPYPCPTSVSSGIHAMLMATALCRQTSLFGFSYSRHMLSTRGGHDTDRKHGLYPGHSWNLDVDIIRLLHLASQVSVCTADDPEVLQRTLDAKTLHDYQ